MVKRRKKSEIEKIYEKIYQDQLNLTRAFILTSSRLNIPLSSASLPMPQSTKKKPTKKQLKALAEGRKKLALLKSKQSLKVKGG